MRRGDRILDRENLRKIGSAVRRDVIVTLCRVRAAEMRKPEGHTRITPEEQVQAHTRRTYEARVVTYRSACVCVCVCACASTIAARLRLYLDDEVRKL